MLIINLAKMALIDPQQIKGKNPTQLMNVISQAY